jgi:hypothetical protein
MPKDPEYYDNGCCAAWEYRILWYLLEWLPIDMISLLTQMEESNR